MRRSVQVLAALCAVGAVVLANRGGGDGSGQIAVVFDRTNGIVAGQQVKVAGVVAGKVDRVDLAPGPKARMVLEVEKKYTPFRADATCTILPEGLLSENFVSCDPGSPNRPELSKRSGVSTVPVEHTTIPASLQNVLDVFSVPTDERLRVLINELGAGTAGRGEDINDLIRRSYPALTQAQRLLTVLDRQSQTLTSGIRETDQVLAAVKPKDLRRFVDRAGAVARTTAEHRGPLGQAVRRMPALLTAARPALASLDQTIASGTPLLRSVRAATPRLADAVRDLPGFVDSSLPAISAVGKISDAGSAALPKLRPVAGDLRSAATRVAPMSDAVNRFLIDFRDRGGIEGTLSMLFAAARWSSAFDDTSHIGPLFVKAFPQCLADPSVIGCAAKYDEPGHGTIPPDDPACGPQDGALWSPLTSCTSTSPNVRRKATRVKKARRPSAPAPGRTGSPPSDAPPTAPGQQPLGGVLGPLLSDLGHGVGADAAPKAPQPVDGVHQLLDYLLKP